MRAARLKRSLTLESLAEITGIPASTLSRMEAGKRALNFELLIRSPAPCGSVRPTCSCGTRPTRASSPAGQAPGRGVAVGDPSGC
ncbi:MAG: helix-turn-helix domain-containing protein [Microbacterium sp.]